MNSNVFFLITDGSTDYFTNLFVEQQKNANRYIFKYCAADQPIPMALCQAFESAKNQLWTKNPQFTAAELADNDKAEQCLRTLPREEAMCKP